MNTSVFVTGTDTGVGKTHVALKFIHQAKRQGLRVAGYKPVASGCEWIDEQWKNNDALALQQTSSFPLDYSVINPYAFEPPIAPHIAAAEQHVQVEMDVLLENYNLIRSQADIVVVEGAGGCLVPINENQNMLDIAKVLDLPLSLVVGMKLGCINHAMLSIEAIRNRGLTLNSVVFNQFSKESMKFSSDVIATIKRLSKCENTFAVDFEQG